MNPAFLTLASKARRPPRDQGAKVVLEVHNNFGRFRLFDPYLPLAEKSLLFRKSAAYPFRTRSPASNQRHSQTCCHYLMSPSPVLFESSFCLLVILGKIFVHKSLFYKHFEMVKIGAGTSQPAGHRFDPDRRQFIILYINY